MIEKIIYEKYQIFFIDYYKNKYPHQRFGQAFLNEFFPKVVDSELYYTTSQFKAEEIILGRYVNYDSRLYVL